MQVQFNADKTIDGHERMQVYFSEVIAESFKRFEDKITRVEVHVGDENNDKFGVDDKRCMIEVRLSGKNPLAVTHHADTIEKAKIKSEVQFAKFSGEDGLKYLNEIKIGIGFAFGYLIMMFIIIYGNMVMRSVIEEKTNRIIEIIIFIVNHARKIQPV